jgi:biopolymer transport protein ExbB
MFKILVEGGIMMIPLLLASIWGMVIILEKYRFLKVEKNKVDDLTRPAREALASGRKDIINSFCRSNKDNLLTPLLKVVIDNNGEDKIVVEEKLERMLDKISFHLREGMSTLATIASVSPFLGLLGTVLGMINAFNRIVQSGVGKPEIIASGISEALITTATGLFIAIPVLLIYNYLKNKIDSLEVKLEDEARFYLEKSLKQKGGEAYEKAA